MPSSCPLWVPEPWIRPGLGVGKARGNFELHVRLDVIGLENSM